MRAFISKVYEWGMVGVMVGPVVWFLYFAGFVLFFRDVVGLDVNSNPTPWGLGAALFAMVTVGALFIRFPKTVFYLAKFLFLVLFYFIFVLLISDFFLSPYSDFIENAFFWFMVALLIGHLYYQWRKTFKNPKKQTVGE